MATNYSIAQLTGSGVVNSVQLNVSSVPPQDYNDEVQDFQQLIFQTPSGSSFNAGTSYLIELNLPQDKNYNLNYGVRLLNLPSSSTGQNLRDNLNYQFVKYISIPQINNMGTDVSTV